MKSTVSGNASVIEPHLASISSKINESVKPIQTTVSTESISVSKSEMEIFEITSDPTKILLPHIQVQTSVSNTPLSLLIDSGSSISLIKFNCIQNTPKLRTEVINLKGIDPTEECTQTMGHFNLKLYLSNSPRKFITHKFHLIKNINLPYDGIIGSDMLDNFKCTIDYNKDVLKIDDEDIKLQFRVPTYIIPPRSEMIIECSVKNPEINEGFILDQNISDTLLVANCFVRVKDNNRINISIINTSESSVTLNSNLNLVIISKSNSLVPKDAHSINYTNCSKEYDTYYRTKSILDQLRISHLNSEEKDALFEICSEYSDIFHLPGELLTYTTAIKHEIKTNSDVPIHTKSYRFPEVHKEEVRKQTNIMLEQGIIQPSNSPWSSPIWIVPKKLDASGQQKWRVVIDYRKLNDVTIGDTYPIPQISEILDQLGNSKYFSTLDLASGFHQIPLDPADAAKTAFNIPQGHYEFTRMPFGLKNAPATFQRLMNTALSGLQGIRCFVYLDDIVIYSHNLQTQIENLKLVFQKLREFNLKLQPDKCEFLRREVGYLGHVITEEGVKPNPDKIKAVTQFSTPSSPKDIKSFLGLVSYYRRFIPDFSKIAKPLTSLLRKDTVFKWENQQQLAFDTLKRKLTTAPILCYPDFTKPFILTCDASNYSIAAVLSQGLIGKDKPIAFASRTLNKSESNYSTTEKELLAIIFGCKTFRPYLYGRKFQIVTDHRPLKWLFNHKDPSSKLQRWRLKLEEFEYEIIYRKGKLNSVADALSRYPVNPIYPEKPSTDDHSNSLDSITDFGNINLSPQSNDLNLDFNDLEIPSLQPSPEVDPLLIPPIENTSIQGGTPLLAEQPSVSNPAIFNPSIEIIDLPNPENQSKPDDINLESLIPTISTEHVNPSISNNDNEITQNPSSILNNSGNNISTDTVKHNAEYSKFLKEIASKSIQYDTKIIERNESLLKSNCKIVLIPSSIDLDESNAYIQEIMNNIENFNEIMYCEKQLHSFNKVLLNNKDIYLIYTKVHHFDECTYPEIFHTLKIIKSYLLQNYTNITEIAISDFKNPFENNSFIKIYNILTYLFHNTNITINIYHDNIIYPAVSEIKKILRENHDLPIAGHLGSVRMLKRIQEKYYWKGMRHDVENYVKTCSLCQENKALRKTNRAPMQITTTSNAPFQRVALDIVGPLPESGTAKLKYIMTLQDDLTKFCAAYPLRGVSAEETSDCLLHFISMFGIPKMILTDQGTNFTAELFKKTCEFLKIKQLWSTPYHPQTQGALERSHSTLKEYLKSYVNENQDNWPRYVFTAMLAYNTAVHCTTHYTPYELIFGHKAFIPDSIYDEVPYVTYPDYVKMLQHRLKFSRQKALEYICKSKETSKTYYDQRSRKVQYKVGQYVYLKNHLRLRKALSPIWKGPFKIVKIHGNNTLSLLINRRHIKHHYDEVKPASDVDNHASS